MFNNPHMPITPMVSILKLWAYCNKLSWRSEEKYIEYLYTLYNDQAVKLN